MAMPTGELVESLCEDPTSSRERLLPVAGILFAAAGANLSAIGHHFAAKEGLYKAAIEHILASTQTVLGALLGPRPAPAG